MFDLYVEIKETYFLNWKLDPTWKWKAVKVLEARTSECLDFTSGVGVQVDAQDLGDVGVCDVSLFETLSQQGCVSRGVGDAGVLYGTDDQVCHHWQQFLLSLFISQQRVLKTVERRQAPHVCKSR